MLSLLTESPPDAFGFKHPFMLLVRPLGLALLGLGVPAKAATGLVMAGIGALRVALVFLFLRVATVGRPEAVALAALFAVTSTQLITAMVPETYGFASLSLILIWLIAQSRLQSPERFRLPPYLAAVLAAGITITNAVQPFAAELLVAWRSWGLRAAASKLLRFGVIFAASFFLMAVLLWPSEILAALRDPVAAVKAIWWMQTKGPTTGLGKVLQTIFGFSFVSPEYTTVHLPETTEMLDYRHWSFPAPGALVVAAWLALVAVGTVAGLAHPTYRASAFAISLTLLFNIVFHLGFQFRGSLYIYTGHTHFLVFALASGVAPWLAGRRHARTAFVIAIVALSASVATVNLPAAAEFATRFDVPNTQCPAPCVNGQ